MLLRILISIHFFEVRMQVCKHCSKALTTNEIAISMRLLGRDGRNLFCRECLAKELKVDVTVIDKKIEQFRAMNCPLFV